MYIYIYIKRVEFLSNEWENNDYLSYSVSFLSLVLPCAVVERAGRFLLQPSLYTMFVKGMIAVAERNLTFAVITLRWTLSRVTLDARLHYMFFADSTVLNLNVPPPQSHGVPFLYFKSWLCLHFDSAFWEEVLSLIKE